LGVGVFVEVFRSGSINSSIREKLFDQKEVARRCCCGCSLEFGSDVINIERVKVGGGGSGGIWPAEVSQMVI
jgi:hypothetical protein